MPRITPQHELDALVDLIAKAADGIDINTILAQLGGTHKRRRVEPMP